MDDYSQASREELVRKVRELEEKVRRQDRLLGSLAVMDGLTKLSNRKTVLDRLQQEVARAERYGVPLSMLLIDVDHFKRVNDEHGHLAGDRTLIDIAAMLQRQIRVIDFAGCYGGQEFLVVFPVTTLEQARVVAERIRESASRAEFADGVSITVSGGLVQFRGGTVDALIGEAGELLRQAKDNGRNRIESARAR